MTTPTKPQTSALASSQATQRQGPTLRPQPTSSRRNVVRGALFALLACGLLVGPVFAFNMARGNSQSTSVDDVRMDPETYAAQAVQRFATLSAIESAGATANLTKVALPAGLDAQAQAALQASLAQTLTALDQVLAEQLLPEVPLDYVPGAPVKIRLPTSAGYTLPSFPSGPTLELLAQVRVEAQASPMHGYERSSPLNDLLMQVQGVQAQLEGVLGSLPDTGGVLEGLPVNGGPLSGLPVGLGTPGQANGAGDAVDPDEAGASLANGHAKAVLGVTSQAYASTEVQLTNLLRSYQDLALRLEEALSLTQQIKESSTQAIQMTLDDRLAAIDIETRTLTTQANRIVLDYVKFVNKAGDNASLQLGVSLEEQSAIVNAAGAAATGNISAQIQSVVALAESRKAAVRTIVDNAAGDLGRVGASEEELLALDAIRAAATATIMKIERDTRVKVTSLTDDKAVIDAEVAKVQKDLLRQVTAARANLNATLSESLAGTDDVKSYLIQFAQARAEQLGDREIELATEALTKLDVKASEHAAKLVKASLKSTEAAAPILATTSGLVDTIEGLAVGEVGKDLEYILKVVEDYKKVPTDERKARAAHWGQTANQLTGLVDNTLTQGTAVERLAQQAVDAALRARVDINALL